MTKLATDQTILRELGERLAQARLERNLTQARLAEEAGLGKRTVERMESGSVATQLSGFIRVCRVLGIIDRFDLFLPERTPGPITQLRLHGRRRRRASAKNTGRTAASKWEWRDER